MYIYCTLFKKGIFSLACSGISDADICVYIRHIYLFFEISFSDISASSSIWSFICSAQAMKNSIFNFFFQETKSPLLLINCFPLKEKKMGVYHMSNTFVKCNTSNTKAIILHVMSRVKHI